jgi:hypothetical protein
MNYKNEWAESLRGAVGVRCPDLGGKMRPLPHVL